jgi:hypothetical protein
MTDVPWQARLRARADARNVMDCDKSQSMTADMTTQQKTQNPGRSRGVSGGCKASDYSARRVRVPLRTVKMRLKARFISASLSAVMNMFDVAQFFSLVSMSAYQGLTLAM